MKRIISERLALRIIGSILALFALFHVLILLGLIPYNVVWGGKLTSHAGMLKYEAISLAVTLFMLAIVAIRAGIIPLRLPHLALRMVFGTMFLLFLLNSLGNATAVSLVERLLTPFTLILAFCCLRLTYPFKAFVD
jgi:hypothetical protein